jgi:hypothetical protein
VNHVCNHASLRAFFNKQKKNFSSFLLQTKIVVLQCRNGIDIRWTARIANAMYRKWLLRCTSHMRRRSSKISDDKARCCRRQLKLQLKREAFDFNFLFLEFGSHFPDAACMMTSSDSSAWHARASAACDGQEIKTKNLLQNGADTRAHAKQFVADLPKKAVERWGKSSQSPTLQASSRTVILLLVISTSFARSWAKQEHV